MESPSLSELLKSCSEAFGFLEEAGYVLQAKRLEGSGSFQGGFALLYARQDRLLAIQYGGMEFTVTLAEEQLFGDREHPGFAGNEFSREHLLEHLADLADSVRVTMLGRGLDAV